VNGCSKLPAEAVDLDKHETLPPRWRNGIRCFLDRRAAPLTGEASKSVAAADESKS